jgi:transposase
MKPISMDLRTRIIEAYDAGEGTRQQIADRFKVSLPMVKKLLAQRKKLGNLEPQNHRCGRKRILDEQDLTWLRETVEKKPDMTLEELTAACRKPCSIMTISRGLKQLGASYKKNR